MKKASSKSTKSYDRTIKEIATHNDNIEKYASERFAIYRRCKLEEIDLPLEKGKLDRVPVEEDQEEEEDAMEVNGTQEDTQTAIKVKEYGIEVDFETLSDEAQEVGQMYRLKRDIPLIYLITGRQRSYGERSARQDQRTARRD